MIKNKKRKKKKQRLLVEVWKIRKYINVNEIFFLYFKEVKRGGREKGVERVLTLVQIKIILESYIQEKKKLEGFLRFEKEIREKVEKKEKKENCC